MSDILNVLLKVFIKKNLFQVIIDLQIHKYDKRS